MNKFLITGLSIGKESGICNVCNFDYEWIFNNPSILIFTDKLLVPDVIWKDVNRLIDEKKGDDTVDKSISQFSEHINKSLKLIFEIAKSEGIIEVVYPKKIINDKLRDKILNEIEKDREKLLDLFPTVVKLGDQEKVPGSIYIDGYEYCWPSLFAIYSSLILSKVWDANCILKPRTLNYCKYKFGINDLNKKNKNEDIKAFKTIFEGYIPNELLLPDYIIESKERCHKCTREKNCKDSYLKDLEKNLIEFIKWRDYDEIQQIKSIIERISKINNNSIELKDADDIVNEFREIEIKTRKKVFSIFPKVKRWTNISTMMSAPVALISLATGNILLSIISASIAGASQATNKFVDFLSSKNNWITLSCKETKVKNW